MSDSRRTPLTPDLVAAMAAASGSPIADADLESATQLLDALYDLESKLDRFDVSNVDPEFTWDARWERTE